jgi:hypothetical protein
MRTEKIQLLHILQWVRAIYKTRNPLPFRQQEEA